MISVLLPGAGSFQKEMPSTSASSSITIREVGESRFSVRRTCRQLVTWRPLDLVSMVGALARSKGHQYREGHQAGNMGTKLK